MIFASMQGLVWAFLNVLSGSWHPLLLEQL